MKICSRCKLTKEDSDFNKNGGKRSGLQSYCKLCHREVTRHVLKTNPERREKLNAATVRRLNLNKAYVIAHLLEHPCVDCGETNPVLLEHDHVRGAKLAHVTKLMYQKVPLRKLLAEIEKCDVRCVRCHRLKTSRANGSYRLGYTSNPYLEEAKEYWKLQKTKGLVGLCRLELQTSTVSR